MYHHDTPALTVSQRIAATGIAALMLSACVSNGGGGSLALIGGGSSLDWDYNPGYISYSDGCLDDNPSLSCQ